MERPVECSGGKGKCDSGTKPQATRSCNLGRCPEWIAGDWSQVNSFTAGNAQYTILQAWRSIEPTVALKPSEEAVDLYSFVCSCEGSCERC